METTYNLYSHNPIKMFKGIVSQSVGQSIYTFERLLSLNGR